MAGWVAYEVTNASQFWSELEGFLDIDDDSDRSVQMAIRSYFQFAGTYRQDYLSTSQDIRHCCDYILEWAVFEQNPRLVCDTLIDLSIENTDSDVVCVIYRFLLVFGREEPKVARWMKMKDMFTKLLRQISNDSMRKAMDDVKIWSIELMYEMCRQQKLSSGDFKKIDESFIGYLFDLVEHTRDNDDESINYSVIKLILAFNEQFMVATLPKTSRLASLNNIVIETLAHRTGSSTTFGENIIFMLNRTADPCLHLLILKLLYLITTTPSLFEYFYTNDLRVLVDVFIRELNDLPDESETLRHTYLRVLYPLLVNTQLRQLQYKRPNIRKLLMSLVSEDSNYFKPVSSTTRRLVERCMNVDWFNSLNVPSIGINREATRSDTSFNRIFESVAPASPQRRMNALALEAGTTRPTSLHQKAIAAKSAISNTQFGNSTNATMSEYKETNNGSNASSPKSITKPIPPPPRKNWRCVRLKKQSSNTSLKTTSSYEDSNNGMSPGFLPSPMICSSPKDEILAASSSLSSPSLSSGIEKTFKEVSIASYDRGTLGISTISTVEDDLSQNLREMDIGVVAQ